MHTRYIQGSTFHYNSDLSGNVEIISPTGGLAIVPGSALLEFVAAYVRSERVAELEQLPAREVLGIE